MDPIVTWSFSYAIQLSSSLKNISGMYMPEFRAEPYHIYKRRHIRRNGNRKFMFDVLDWQYNSHDYMTHKRGPPSYRWVDITFWISELGDSPCSMLKQIPSFQGLCVQSRSYIFSIIVYMPSAACKLNMRNSIIKWTGFGILSRSETTHPGKPCFVSGAAILNMQTKTPTLQKHSHGELRPKLLSQSLNW